MPQSSRSFFRIAALSAVTVLLLAGCGRKGPLDLPPASSAQQEPAQVQSDTGDASVKSGNQRPAFSQDGRAQAPAGQKKKLPGDWLID